MSRERHPKWSKPSSSRWEDGDWLLPGEEVWEICGKAIPSDAASRECIEDLQGQKFNKVSLVALPSQWVICQLIWLETSDEKAAPDLLRMQCERRGLTSQNEVWGFSIIRREKERLLAQVLVLQNALPDGILVEKHTRFEAWARCLKLPLRALCLWRSLGVLSIALTDAQGMVYFQSLPHESLTHECLFDIQSILWMAVAQHWIPAPESICIPAQWHAVDMPSLKRLQLSIHKIETYDLALPESPLELTPHPIQQFRRQRQRQRRTRWIALAVGGVYVTLLLYHLLTGFIINVSNKQMERKLNASLPEMTRLQRIVRKMDALTPAIDTKTYPLEILHRIMILLPESGIRLTRFEINGNRIECAGESSTAREAFSFLEAIQSADALHYIDWDDPPQPVPLPNDTTRFSIQGTINGAYHEPEAS